MSDIPQLASGVGEWGTKVPILLHYLAQGERAREGVAFPPLGKSAVYGAQVHLRSPPVSCSLILLCVSQHRQLTAIARNPFQSMAIN